MPQDEFIIRQIIQLASVGSRVFLECGDMQCCTTLPPKNYLFCFGPFGELNSPIGQYHEVSAGPGYQNHTVMPLSDHYFNVPFCGIEANNHSITCWSTGEFPQIIDNFPKTGLFSKISTNYYYACAVKTPPESSLHCWGNLTMAQDVIEQKPIGKFLDIVTCTNEDKSFACALSIEFKIHCWGMEINATNVPKDKFLMIGQDKNTVCGIAFKTHEIKCFSPIYLFHTKIYMIVIYLAIYYFIWK